MAEEKFTRLRDWVEPAHPAVVKLYDDLVSIYKHIREKHQTEIDQAFDRVSRQIGFVVTATIPVVFVAGDKGAIKQISMGAEHLKDTLFEKQLISVLKPQPDPWVSAAGSYKLYLIWYEALKLKLRTDWMEPAHIMPGVREPAHSPGVMEPAHFRRDWVEPAHWFDPGRAIAVEEVIMIEAINEVYPDLRLADRVAFYRDALRRKIRPEIMEPAHFRQVEQGLKPEAAQEILRELASVLKRYGY